MIKENYFSKKLSSGDMLDYSAEFFRANLKPLIIMTLIFHVPVVFVCNALISSNGLFNAIFSDFADDSELSMVLVSVLLIYVGAIILSLYQFTIYHAYSGAVAKFTYEKTVFGETLKPTKALKFGFKKIGWLMLYNYILSQVVGIIVCMLYFIFYFGIFFTAFLLIGAEQVVYEDTATDALTTLFLIGFLIIVLAVIVVFLYFSVRLSLVVPSIVIDNCNCFTAVKRSFELTKKRVFKTFWTTAFGSYIISLATSALSALASLVMFFDGNLLVRIFSGLSAGLGALTAPLSVIIPTLIFIHSKKQNGDIDFEQRLREEVSSVE